MKQRGRYKKNGEREEERNRAKIKHEEEKKKQEQIWRKRGREKKGQK